jgi:hypothetical protein
LEDEARERKAQAAGQPQGTKSLRPETDDETGRSDEKAAAMVGVGQGAQLGVTEELPVVHASDGTPAVEPGEELDPVGAEIAARRSAEREEAQAREVRRAEALRRPRVDPREWTAARIMETDF